MKILPLFILLACIAWPARAQDEEPRAAPARGLLKRGPLVKGKTTTTTPAPSQDDPEYDEEGDYPAEGEAQEPSTEPPATSTTEGKKLVAGGVRPFRNNSDLLEILKKRRAEAKSNGSAASSSSSQSQDSGSEAAKSNYSAKSKKRFNNAPVTREVSSEDAPPAPAAKPSRGRFAATRSVQEPEEEQNDAAPPARNARNFRRGGN